MQKTFAEECVTVARKAVLTHYGRRRGYRELVDRAESFAWEFAQTAPDGVTPEQVAWYAIQRAKTWDESRNSKRSLTHPRFRKRRKKLHRRIKADQNTTDPATIVQVRLDWQDFLPTLSRRERMVAELYFVGHTTGEIAKLMQVTPGAISQTRGKLREKWETYVGDRD